MANNPAGKEVREFLPISEESNLETIDYALYKWLDEDVNIFCTTNKGWEKTPVKWTSAERSVLSKKKREFRDKDGALILPIITVERTDVTKDPTFKGTAWGNIPPIDDYRGGSISIMRKVNQKKTSNFENAVAKKDFGQLTFKLSKNRTPKTVYQTINIPMPVYVAVTYKISIWSEFQQQMNEMVQPFMTRTGGINYFLISHEGHRFEAFIQQNFAQNNNVASLAEEERKYETTIEIKVLGHLISAGSNENQPRRSARENAVEFKIPRERSIFADSIDDAVQQMSSIPILVGGSGRGGAAGSAGGVSSNLETRDEGLALSSATKKINFVGSGVTATAVGDNITVTIPGAAGAAAASADVVASIHELIVVGEIPTGSIDGVNTDFTVTYEPLANSESVYLNGVLIADSGIGDYTISGKTVTFADAPEIGDTVRISYIKNSL